MIIKIFHILIYKGICLYTIMAKNLSDIKELKLLKKKKKEGVYDSLINKIRSEIGIPITNAMLSRIALDGYLKKNIKPNGEYDLKGILGIYDEIILKKQKEKEELKLIKKIEKLKEKTKAIESALTKK